MKGFKEAHKRISTTTMNTDHMKIHFTSQTCIEFILFPIQTGAFTLRECYTWWR